MSLIYFYDATPLDTEQLTAGLAATDHHWEFVKEQVSTENLNPDTEVLSVFVASHVTAEIIAQLPKLKLIACRSTGFNNVDLAAAEKRGITVVNVPSYGEKTVAEYAFALLLSLTRKVAMIGQHPDIADQPQLMGTDLNGKTIGVIGTGRIGRNVIKIASGFSMRVIAYDPFPAPNIEAEFGFTYTGFDDLLAQSDIITLHVPYLGTNKHVLNEAAFAAMKDGVTIINTSRGELIDTAALINALQTGKVKQAGLDVTEDEQIMSLRGAVESLRSDHQANAQDYLHSVEVLALQKMPNVLLTPHNAFNTIEALGRINQTTADNIIGFWYGDSPNKVAVKTQTGSLFIARHAESEWNALGKWTGTTDVHLSQKGFHEAAQLGLVLPDVPISIAYASEQIRTLETLEGILDASRQFDVPIQRDAALNERDYGDYTGKNKWEVKEAIGEDNFNKLRRDWDYPVPNGETLKDVFNRVFPFYKEVIVPQLLAGKNVLITAHGNSIRALMHHIESVPQADMGKIEMLFGTILEYQVDTEGKMLAKKAYQIDSPKPPA